MSYTTARFRMADDNEFRHYGGEQFFAISCFVVYSAYTSFERFIDTIVCNVHYVIWNLFQSRSLLPVIIFSTIFVCFFVFVFMSPPPIVVCFFSFRLSGFFLLFLYKRRLFCFFFVFWHTHDEAGVCQWKTNSLLDRQQFIYLIIGKLI